MKREKCKFCGHALIFIQPKICSSCGTKLKESYYVHYGNSEKPCFYCGCTNPEPEGDER